MTYPIVQANDLTSMGVTITPPSYVDISPLQAATLALHGAYTSKRDPRRKQRMRRLT